MGGSQSRSSRRVQPSPLNPTPNARRPSSSQRNAMASLTTNRGTMANQKMRTNTSNRTKDMKGESDGKGVRKESTFQMVHNPTARMQITVDALPTRKTIVLQVTDWDTIRAVKMKIQQKEGIPVDRQMLIYAGRMLADESTLASYSIRRWPILHMITYPIPKINVSVETPTNEMITLQVDLWNTIQNIKAMIAGMVAVGPNRQKLMYSGKQLEDHKILADYNMKSGTTLCVVYFPIQIFIKMWSGKTVAVEVDTSDAVHEVMAKILNKERTPIKHHSLVFGGKRLDKERTLAAYNIQKESTLHLVTAVSSRIRNRIHVWLMNRKTIMLAVEGSDTIACVKEKIHLATGIPANAQTLKIRIVKEELELENDRTVSYYKIRMDSTLYLYCKDRPH